MIRTPTSALWVRMLKKRRSLSPARKNLSTYWPLGKESNRTSATNYLITRTLWWSRWDSNPRPLRCESDYRQNAKYLPFLKLQPPREINGFPVLSHSLPSSIGSVLFFGHVL